VSTNKKNPQVYMAPLGKLNKAHAQILRLQATMTWPT